MTKKNRKQAQIHEWKLEDNIHHWLHHLREQLRPDVTDPDKLATLDADIAALEELGKKAIEIRDDLADSEETYDVVLAPTTTAVGVIQPPSKEAVFWATKAVFLFPEAMTGFGNISMIMVCLHVLKLCGDGRVQEASAIALDATRLPGLIMDLDSNIDDSLSGQMVDDYMTLMGIKKKMAITSTLLEIEEIRKRYDLQSTQTSSPSQPSPVSS